MYSFGIGVNDKFEGNKIKSSIEFPQGNGKYNSQDGAMHGNRIHFIHLNKLN